MKKLLLFFIFSLLIRMPAFTQNTVVTIDQADQQLCNIYLYDNGGSGAPYGANRNDEITIRSDNPSFPRVRFSFPAFDIHPSDTLYIYDGTSSAAPLIGRYNNSNTSLPFSIQASINNSSGALTFRFKTDSANQAAGFWGSEVCIPQCQSVIAALSPAECIPAPVIENNIQYLNVCFGDNITFAALIGPGAFPENDYAYHQSETTSTYTWDFGDGTTASGRIVTHRYNQAHGYNVSLTISDVNGCTNTNSLGAWVRISGYQDVELNPPPTICSGSDVAVHYGADDSSIIVIRPPVISSYARFDSVMFIPDGPNCPQQCYNAYVTVNSFAPNQTIQTANDILSICVGIEHSYSGDLGFRIICPNGRYVVLDPNSHTGGAYLGTPYGGSSHETFDNGCNPANNLPGTPDVYCWSEYYNPPATRTLDYLSSQGVSPIPHTDTVNNTNYIRPNNSLSNLTGCPLNGIWNIEICDDFAIDNGYIFWWQLNLDPRLLPTGWTYTVGIDTVIWTGPFIHPLNDSAIIIRPVSGGNYLYTITTVDHYGCSFDTSFVLNVVTQPVADLGPDRNICINSFITLDAGTADHYLWNTGDTAQTIYISQSGSFSVTVTNTDGNALTCIDSTSVNVNLTTSYAPPLPTVNGAFRCNPGSVTLTASGGTSYIWYSALTGGSIVNTGPIFNTPLLSTTTTYYVSNMENCESMHVPVVAQINNISIDAGSDKNISCGNSDILNTNTVYSGSNNLIYSWVPSSGLNSVSVSNPTASPTQTTDYTVMVTDGYCSTFDEVTVNVTPAIIGINFNANPQTLTSSPFNVQFDNLSPNLSNYHFTWYFGDGTSLQSDNLSVFHQYNQNGVYDVSLVAASMDNGCSDIRTAAGLISCSGGITCTHTATINETDPVSTCLGTPAYISCIPVSGASYQWNYNGVPVPNSDNSFFYAENPGEYGVTINLGGCAITSANIHVVVNTPPAVPVITANGSIVPCLGGSMTLSVPAGAASYLWSDNETSRTITITDPGVYTVQISDTNGCSSQSQPYVAGASPIGNPDICIVSIDSASGKNIIVWNKPVSNVIDHFNIYGEGIQTNIFNHLGSVPYSGFSIFTDQNSFPGQQAYLYKITAVDTCNAETNLSAYHKTIHLSINQGMGNTFNLLWNFYEGFSFSSYHIYRGTTSGDMSLLTTLASSLNSYTDMNPPVGYVYYQIEAVNPNPCMPSKAIYNTTRSNIASNNAAAIEHFAVNDNDLKIYPNPASELLYIESGSIRIGKPWTIEIYSADGRLLLNHLLLNTLTSVNIRKLVRGIYFVKVEDSDAFIVKKFVKE